MIKKIKKIPTFKSIKEEAKFWDTHSFADYWDQFSDIELVVELEKPANDTLIVRIQKSLKQKLEKLAKKKGISVSSLSRILLTKQLRSLAP